MGSVIDESGNGLHALERAAAAMQVSLRGFDGYNAVAYGIQTKKLSIPNCAPENVEAVTKLCTTANGADCPEVNDKIVRSVKALAVGGGLCLNNAFVALSVIGKDGNLVGAPWVTIASTGPSNRTVARYNASLGAGVPGGIPAGGPVGVGGPPMGPPPPPPPPPPPGPSTTPPTGRKPPPPTGRSAVTADMWNSIVEEATQPPVVTISEKPLIVTTPSEPSVRINLDTKTIQIDSGHLAIYAYSASAGSVINLTNGEPIDLEVISKLLPNQVKLPTQMVDP